MEIPSHLERMGMELKCPICLSLFDTAVSLSCNHVFCNSCIVKSMKVGSDCPICKLPYRRREVHPAPHMDNLVTIYKSMEVASGIDIFVTQNAPSTKILDGEKQSAAAINHGEEDTHGLCEDGIDNQRTFKRKRTRKTGKCNLKISSPIAAKPSFPTKKRVQVPQYPLLETPSCPAKLHDGLDKISSERPENSSTVLKEKPVFNEKREPVFSPFFWLREEEDAEKLSQDTDENHFMEMPLPNAPSFSDIMDSDDENPSKLSPTGQARGNSNVGDIFDSEVFEWTQRACSPELGASPVKMQVPDSDETDGNRDRDTKAALQDTNTPEEYNIETIKLLNSEQGHTVVDVVQPSESSPRSRYDNDEAESNKSNKRGCKITKRVQYKTCKNKSTNSPQEQTRCIDENYFNLEKTNKLSKRSCFRNSVSKPTPQNVPAVSVAAEILNQGEKSMSAKSAVLSKKSGSDGVYTSKTQGNCKKVNAQNMSDLPEKPRKRKPDSAKNFLEEISIAQDQTSGIAVPLNTIQRKEKSRKVAEENSGISSECSRVLRCGKRLKASDNCISRDTFTDEKQGHIDVSTKESGPLGKVHGNSDVKIMDGSSIIQKRPPLMKEKVLQKCKNVPNKIQCAFCHSSEVSEALGEMMHYHNNTPVAADFSGVSKLIHSHRSCTEWAPNVYFEDDNAINLEAEIARSRRIKCCCCGIKGAALGCYEKTCRRSFHIPCAKLIPQCRWDTDNFVMLCPLHASCILPNEISGSQDMRKKGTSKQQIYSKCVQPAMITEISMSQKWNLGGSPEKLVLCYSALTVVDRETVSGFERLSGATILKKWDSSVTHVIASTDGNGACRRTLKILMGILEGKWILSIEWIKACMKAMEAVDEELYEIHVDIHGIRDGPWLGRLRIMNKQPKLFDGIKFYFAGDFITSYKGYLQDLVTAAGGMVLHRKPISRDRDAFVSGSSTSPLYIIYSLELPNKCDPSKKERILNSRLSEAEALANSTGARAASNMWVLNSIAACKLQGFAE